MTYVAVYLVKAMENIQKEPETNYINSPKLRFDRAVNIIVGIFAILLGVYVTLLGIIGAGFGAGIIGLLYIVLGPTSLIFGIHLLKKKVDLENKETKVNFGRALLIAIAILIIAFQVLKSFS